MRREQRERAAFVLAAAYASSASPTTTTGRSFHPSSPARRAGSSRVPSWRPTSARSAASHCRLALGQRSGAAGRTDLSAAHATIHRCSRGEDNGHNNSMLGADFRRRRRENTPRRRRAITTAGMTRGPEVAAAPGVVDCETLQGENLRLKLALNRATEENKRYGANRTRLERELFRADGKVEMLLTELEQPPGHRDQRILDNVRREVEKCAVVRTLAQQKEHLQQWLARRERELEALKRIQEWSAVAEMTAATEEYFLETQRLRRLLAQQQQQQQQQQQRQRQHIDENSPSAYCPDKDDEWNNDEGGDIVREEYTSPSGRHTTPSRSVNESAGGGGRRGLQTNRPTRNVRSRQPQSTDIEAIDRGEHYYQDEEDHPGEPCGHPRRRSRQSADESTFILSLGVPDDDFHEIYRADGSNCGQRPPSPMRRGSPPHPARMAPRAASREIAPTRPASPGAWRSRSDRDGVGSPGWSGGQGRRRCPAVSNGGIGAPGVKWGAPISAGTRASETRPGRRSRPVSAPSRRDRTDDERPGTAFREDQMSWGRRSHNALSPGYKRWEDAGGGKSGAGDAHHVDDGTIVNAAAAFSSPSGTSTSVEVVVVTKNGKGGLVAAGTEHATDDNGGEKHTRYDDEDDDGSRVTNTLPIVDSLLGPEVDRRPRGRGASKPAISATGRTVNPAAPSTEESARHGQESMLHFGEAPAPDNDESDRLVSPRDTPDCGLEGEVPPRGEHGVPRSNNANETDGTAVRHCRHNDGGRGGEGTVALAHDSRKGEESQGERRDAAEGADHGRMDGSDGGKSPVSACDDDDDDDDDSNGRGKSNQSVASSTNALLLDGGSDYRSEQQRHVANPLESGISEARAGERRIVSSAPPAREQGVISSTPTPDRRPQSHSSAPYSTSAASLREWGEVETGPTAMAAGSRVSSYNGEPTIVARGGDTGGVAAGSTHSNVSRASTARSHDGSEKGVEAGAGSSIDLQHSTSNSVGRQERSQPKSVAASRHVHDDGVKWAAIETGHPRDGAGEEVPPELSGSGQSADDAFCQQQEARSVDDEGLQYSQDAEDDDDGDTYNMERSSLGESLAEQRPRQTNNAAPRQEDKINSSSSSISSTHPGNTIEDSDDVGDGGGARVNRDKDDGDYAPSASPPTVVALDGVGVGTTVEADRDDAAVVVTDSSRELVGADSGVHDSGSWRRSSGDSIIAAAQHQDGGGEEGSEYGDDFDDEEEDG